MAGPLIRGRKESLRPLPKVLVATKNVDPRFTAGNRVKPLAFAYEEVMLCAKHCICTFLISAGDFRRMQWVLIRIVTQFFAPKLKKLRTKCRDLEAVGRCHQLGEI